MNPILKYFEYAHLPIDLQATSKRFYLMAYAIEDSLEDGPEKSVALRKLLETKNAAIRATLT